MGADLELGDIPEGVVVGRAGQVAELDVVGRLVGVDVKIKLRLEEDLVLLPVDPGVKVDVAAVRVEADVLDNSGVEEFALAELQGLGAVPAKHPVIPSLST